MRLVLLVRILVLCWLRLRKSPKLRILLRRHHQHRCCVVLLLLLCPCFAFWPMNVTEICVSAAFESFALYAHTQCPRSLMPRAFWRPFTLWISTHISEGRKSSNKILLRLTCVLLLSFSQQSFKVVSPFGLQLYLDLAIYRLEVTRQLSMVLCPLPPPTQIIIITFNFFFSLYLHPEPEIDLTGTIDDKR